MWRESQRSFVMSSGRVSRRGTGMGLVVVVAGFGCSPGLVQPWVGRARGSATCAASASMCSEIEGLLRVNQDLQQQVTAQAPGRVSAVREHQGLL